MDTVCPGCGLRRPCEDGPVHAYMTSSPACWRLFGEVLAREYATPELMAVHRLSVDAYALQHPGGPDRRSVQSVGFHLSRLWLTLDGDVSAEQAGRLAVRLVERKVAFTWLAPPQGPPRSPAPTWRRSRPLRSTPRRSEPWRGLYWTLGAPITPRRPLG